MDAQYLISTLDTCSKDANKNIILHFLRSFVV